MAIVLGLRQSVWQKKIATKLPLRSQSKKRSSVFREFFLKKRRERGTKEGKEEAGKEEEKKRNIQHNYRYYIAVTLTN